MALKNKFIIYIDRLIYTLFLLTAFLVPFNKSIPEISLIIILVSMLYFFLKRDFNYKVLKGYESILIAAALFFSWLAVRSIIQLSSIDIKNIFRYTGILLLPTLMFLSTTCLKEKRIYHILMAFISANLIIAL